LPSDQEEEAFPLGLSHHEFAHPGFPAIDVTDDEKGADGGGAGPEEAAHGRYDAVLLYEETACEAFTYRLRSGKEETVHLDVVLEFNRHPGYLNDLLLHRLTVEAIHALDESDLSKRELTRRLGTSASQLYRLLDPTNTAKSIGQMLALLRILGREVDFVVRPGTTVRNVAV